MPTSAAQFAARAQSLCVLSACVSFCLLSDTYWIIFPQIITLGVGADSQKSVYPQGSLIRNEADF